MHHTSKTSKMNDCVIIFAFITILAVLALLIAKYITINQSPKMNEGFADYQDIKTKTLNWCSKMQKAGLLNADQFDQCVSSFMDVTNGVNRSGIAASKAGMGADFSLYNTRAKQLSSSISSDGNDGGNTIMMMTSEKMTLACRADGTLYQVANIDDPDINQKELYFTLTPINETAYTVMSPYGKFLITDNTYSAAFNGKSMGPLATWNFIKITDSDTGYGSISNVMLESIQFPNFHLVYNPQSASLSIQNGKNDTMVWSITAKSNNTSPNGGNASFVASQFIVKKESILASYKKNTLIKLALQNAITAIRQLANQVANNYADIKSYIQNYLQNQRQLYTATSMDYKTRLDSIIQNSMIPADTKENLIAGLPKPQGLDITGDIITQVIMAIENKKNITAQFINTNAMIPLQQQLAQVTNEDTSQADYDDLIGNLKAKINEINYQIRQNQDIIARQKDKYNALTDDYQYQSDNISRLDRVDKLSGLNMQMLDTYKTQKTYLTKIYPIVIFFLIIGLIYLTYLTIIKFRDNVWAQYKD